MDLFVRSGYNKLVRPVKELNDTVTIEFSLQVSQIIAVVSHAASKYEISGSNPARGQFFVLTARKCKQ
jgi:hypothetical protein